MILRVRRLIKARASGDEGLGLILVIGVSTLIFALAAAATALAVNGISQSRQRAGFETSLALAEAGVDRVLSEVQSAFSSLSSLNADYRTPGPASTECASLAAVTFPTSGEGADGVFSTEAAERSWAAGQLSAIASVAGCRQTDYQGTTTPQGQFVVLKPVSANVKFGKVYALSAVPSFGAASARTRLIKSDYVFMPYHPTNAILTAGPLALSASTTVTAASGVDPTLASVHSNSTITGTGNPTVTGLVSSTLPSTFSSNNFSLNTGGAIPVTATQPIPTVSARSFYAQAATSDPGAVTNWYDLCTDGTVRPYSTGGPCTAPTSASIGTASTSLQVRGWNYNDSGKTWVASNHILDGTYYALQRNIDVGPGNGTFASVTLVAEALNPTTCASKQYGNINWTHFTLSAPAYHNMFMFADSDIVTGANFSAGSFGPPLVSGMFIAGDQIQMETSSQGAVGAVVSADQCPTPPSAGLITTSVVKNPSVYFDPNADAPFSSVITNSLWLDYSGS